MCCQSKSVFMFSTVWQHQTGGLHCGHLPELLGQSVSSARAQQHLQTAVSTDIIHSLWWRGRSWELAFLMCVAVVRFRLRSLIWKERWRMIHHLSYLCPPSKSKNSCSATDLNYFALAAKPPIRIDSKSVLRQRNVEKVSTAYESSIT